MANHKSALKRDRQSKARRLRNRNNKSKMKSAINRVEKALVEGAEDQAKEALQNAMSVIQKTVSRGTIHKKTASRRISRLAKRVHRMEPLA